MRLFLTLFLALAGALAPAQEPLRAIDPDDKTGASAAVVVDEMPLIHTRQVLPLDRRGRVVAPGDAARQTQYVAEALAELLTTAGAMPDCLVKLNVYVAEPSIVAIVQKVLGKAFREKARKPAVSFVVGKLPHPDALIGMDAIAVGTQPTESGRVQLTKGNQRLPYPVLAAALPAGPRVYVAGQAEKGELPEATRKTLESLRATLKYLDLHDGHIVQLKAFLTPMARAAEVERELEKFFNERPVPPIVFVEWKSTLPIEIELIAAAPRTKVRPAEPIEFLTPPGMTASPIYSRVTRVNFGKSVFVSGLYGLRAMDATGEVEEIFASLRAILQQADSDFHHLAKATYYVATDDASRKLNELRPRYFDPKRPPAASKAMVPGVGVEGRGFTLDMIAVQRQVP